jgi:hypothetical protein
MGAVFTATVMALHPKNHLLLRHLATLFEHHHDSSPSQKNTLTPSHNNSCGPVTSLAKET